jgi:hypothetical protein
MRATGYTYSKFTMAKSRTFKSIWTPTLGQPHIAVLNPQPTGKKPMTAWCKIDLKVADTNSRVMALGMTYTKSVDDDPYTHSRVPIDMIFHGWSISLFQAKQQWSRKSGGIWRVEGRA